jgi:hypothetical protein
MDMHMHMHISAPVSMLTFLRTDSHVARNESAMAPDASVREPAWPRKAVRLSSA